MTKLCPKCKRILDESKFNWKFKYIKRTVYCTECSRVYLREHYRNNRQYYINKAHKRNFKLREAYRNYIGNYLSNHKCIDCGESDIVVLEFDHRDRKSKEMEISKMLRWVPSLQKLLIEINKCDIRCANCHRKKTAKEVGSWKLSYMRP